MFPALKVHKSKQFSNWFINSNNKPNNIYPTQNLHSPQHTHTTIDSNETLLTPETLLELTTELIINLKNCRTKLDQFQVITKLAIKYINQND
jgi:hypothetical protein